MQAHDTRELMASRGDGTPKGQPPRNPCRLYGPKSGKELFYELLPIPRQIRKGLSSGYILFVPLNFFCEKMGWIGAIAQGIVSFSSLLWAAYVWKQENKNNSSYEVMDTGFTFAKKVLKAGFKIVTFISILAKFKKVFLLVFSCGLLTILSWTVTSLLQKNTAISKKGKLFYRFLPIPASYRKGILSGYHGFQPLQFFLEKMDCTGTFAKTVALVSFFAWGSLVFVKQVEGDSTFDMINAGCEFVKKSLKCWFKVITFLSGLEGFKKNLLCVGAFGLLAMATWSVVIGKLMKTK